MQIRTSSEKSGRQVFDKQIEVLTDWVDVEISDGVTELRRCLMNDEASDRIEFGGEVTTSAQNGGDGISSQLVVLVTEDFIFEHIKMSHFICRDDISGTLNAHMCAEAVSW